MGTLTDVSSCKYAPINVVQTDTISETFPNILFITDLD